MKKGFALLYVVIFVVLVSFIIGLIMINLASMSITVAQLPDNYKSIYGNQSVVSLGYMLIASNQTATTLTYYGNITYSATVTSRTALSQSATVTSQTALSQEYTQYMQYIVRGNFGQDNIEIYYIKDNAGKIYCVGLQ